MQRQGSPEADRPSEVSTAVTTPAAGVASSTEPKPLKESCNKVRSWADENEEKPAEKAPQAPPTPASTTTPAPQTPSEESKESKEPPKKETPQKEAWAPRIAPRHWPRSPGGGKGVWQPKDPVAPKTPVKGSGKGKGKGKGLVYRPKNEVVEEQEIPDARRPRRRGKVNEYVSYEEQATGYGRNGRRGRGKY